MNIIINFLLFIILSTGSNAVEDTKAVNEFIDEWHQAAWNANSEKYFGQMAEDCIFIGTDPAEVWTKQEFYDWSRSYFENERVWKFKGKNRHVYFNEDRTIAWFDEEVHSSAGIWRGSGVLSKQTGQWKFKQYVLSMTVPNDLMDKVIKDIKQYNDTRQQSD
ncbi:MAG: nuclear transport factor 2 family protein [Bacteroidota bacterium]